MFHMLSCFDLESSSTIDEFQQSLTRFVAHLRERDAVVSVGAIGRRQKHPIMDTDNERSQEFYFILSFRDRNQCDHAVSLIAPHQEPEESIHIAVTSRMTNGVFICWEDV